jgi:energy-coupling factor transporter ATP-binding protein EcfA2
MKLVKARVTNYRSVEDSGDIIIDQMVCLVGKNEAGKTAILQAIAGLNPHPSTPITFDKETDYPRRYLTEYSQRHPKKEAVVITTHWEIEKLEREAIAAEIGEEGLDPGTVMLTRAYADTSPNWLVPINYQKACDFIIEAERLTQPERKQLGSFSSSDELHTALEKLPERSPRQQSLLDRISKMPGKNIWGAVTSKLVVGLPQFMYFSHYDRMAGQLRIDNIGERKTNGPKLETGETVFLDFLEFAGTSVDEISSATTYEGLNAKCEAASNNITGQLQDYWTQNPHLEIEVRVTKAETNDPAPFNAGIIARARVRNNLHKVTVPFSERSAGFIWFFSFLVKFAQVRKSGGSLALLLDEPGLTLHGKAQEDLLRYFSDKLLPNHQVIFSTHSPFMVPLINCYPLALWRIERGKKDRVGGPRTAQRSALKCLQRTPIRSSHFKERSDTKLRRHCLIFLRKNGQG